MKKILTLEMYYSVEHMRYFIRLKLLGIKLAIWEYDSLNETIV